MQREHVSIFASWSVDCLLVKIYDMKDTEANFKCHPFQVSRAIMPAKKEHYRGKFIAKSLHDSSSQFPTCLNVTETYARHWNIVVATIQVITMFQVPGVSRHLSTGSPSFAFIDYCFSTGSF